MKLRRAQFRFRSFTEMIRMGSIVLACCGTTELVAEGQDLNRAREEIYRDLTYRQAELNSTLAQLDQAAIDIEAWLSKMGIAPADLAARLEDVTAERLRLVAIVADLESQTNERLRRLQADPGMLETVFSSNALEIAQLHKEIEQLHRELREKPREVGLQTSVSLEGLASRPFLLTGDRIAPFEEPYFASREIRVRLANRTLEMRRRFDRETDAGTILASIEPGGVVAELVKAPGFDPAETYVTLWVCEDAIEGYRVVSEFLKSRGVRFTWTTDVDEPWVARPESPELDSWGYESP